MKNSLSQSWDNLRRPGSMDIAELRINIDKLTRYKNAMIYCGMTWDQTHFVRCRLNQLWDEMKRRACIWNSMPADTKAKVRAKAKAKRLRRKHACSTN